MVFVLGETPNHIPLKYMHTLKVKCWMRHVYLKVRGLYLNHFEVLQLILIKMKQQNLFYLQICGKSMMKCEQNLDWNLDLT